jgi:hypothetical protein
MPSDNPGRGGLEDSPFSFREIGGGKVFILWRGQQVKILKGEKAASFLERISGQDPLGQQLVMAKVTGNFKRGNEKK